MVWQAVLPRISLAACFLLSGASSGAGQEAVQQAYRIKPSEVAVPAGVPLGQYRRTTTPFGNWTLICDENLHAKQVVCNISQVIVDRAGATVFSWSLAATAGGEPFMILRTAPGAAANGQVSLKFEGRAKPVAVAIEGCNEVVCVAKVPVGPVLREQIRKEANPVISYPMKSGETVSLSASLQGLATALAAIN